MVKGEVLPGNEHSDQSQISKRISSRIFLKCLVSWNVIESNISNPKHWHDDDLLILGGRIGCRGQSPKKKNHESCNYFVCHINGILACFCFPMSIISGLIPAFYLDVAGMDWKVLDHEVYLQGAPFGRDLIHWDRQLLDGFLVRLLTVLAAWVWGS